MSLTIASWNVNSLRVRLPHVLDWLQANKPDVLALQETKITNDLFPIHEIQNAGYQCVFSGQKTYNGMAILARESVSETIISIPELEDPQRRVLGVTLANGVRLINLYVPNGESIGSEKYQYKLNWLKHLDQFLVHELARYPQMVLVGDFNIAPENQDVYDPQAWAGHVLVSAEEREAFRSLLNVGFQDCFRLFPQPEKSYSWWDYRLNAFKRNMGLRIDHILASSPMAKVCKRCFIDKSPRALERPSDHTIVMAEFHR